MKFAPLVLALGLWLGTLSPARCDAFIAGDSIGVGVAAASGVVSLAKSSSAIANGYALRQLQRVPDGSRLYLFLGTNDAVWQKSPAKKRFSLLVKTMQGKQLDVAWVGPPCVETPWGKNVKGFETKLAAMVRDSGITYVSLYDFAGCRLPRGKDGVHFVFSGYEAIWEHISAPQITPDPEASVLPPSLPMPPAEGDPAQN